MSVKTGFWFATIDFANDILDGDFRFVMSNGPGFGSWYIRGITNHVDVITLLGTQIMIVGKYIKIFEKILYICNDLIIIG